MKLYFSPGACSLAAHIALAEGGFTYTTERVDLATHQTATGRDYTTVNPKGYVPALAIDDTQTLTEVAVILQYLALQKPALGLLPATGTLPYFRALEWMTYISSEIHKGFSPLFNPRLADAVRGPTVERLSQRIQYLQDRLGDHAYLMGDQFTAPDAYLFTVLRWAPAVKLDLTPWPAIGRYIERVGARPGVQRAMEEEGLRKH